MVVLVVGALIGLLNGTLVAVFGVQPIIATLAFLFAGRSIAQLLLQGLNPSIADPTVLGIASGSILGVNGLVLAAVVPALLVLFLVRRSVFGHHLLAIGDNPRAAYLSGVPVRRVLIAVYALSGVLAAWAGVMDTSSITSANALSSGLNYELFAITAVVVGIWTFDHVGFVAALVAVVVVCGLVGAVNGGLVAYAGLAPFIVTLATLFGVRGLVYQLTDKGAKTYSVDADTSFAHLGTGTILTIGLPVLIAAVAFVVAHLVLERTAYGLAVQSVGGGGSAASLMGLPVARVTFLTYVLCGVLAGLAGMLQAAQLVSASPIIASGYELQAIATVVIGGTLLTGGSGSQLGTAAGVLLLGVINSFIVQLQLDSTWNNVVSGAFLVVVVVLQRLLVRRRASR